MESVTLLGHALYIHISVKTHNDGKTSNKSLNKRFFVHILPDRRLSI